MHKHIEYEIIREKESNLLQGNVYISFGSIGNMYSFIQRYKNESTKWQRVKFNDTFFFHHILKYSIACERLSFFFHPVIWIEWTLKYSLTKRSSNEANTHTHSLSQHRNSNHINISKHRNQLIIQTNSNDCVAFRLLLFHSMHINKNEGVFHHHYIRIDWCAASTKQMEIRSKGRREKK